MTQVKRWAFQQIGVKVGADQACLSRKATPLCCSLAKLPQVQPSERERGISDLVHFRRWSSMVFLNNLKWSSTVKQVKFNTRWTSLFLKVKFNSKKVKFNTCWSLRRVLLTEVLFNRPFGQKPKFTLWSRKPSRVFLQILFRLDVPNWYESC